MTPVKLHNGPVKIIVKTETGGKPYNLIAADKDAAIWYYRQLDADEKEAHVCLPYHPDEIYLFVDNGSSIVSSLIAPLRPPVIPQLFTPEVKRPYTFDQVEILEDYTLQSPASMLTDEPVILYNPALMKTYPKPVQEFIFKHEMGHQMFDDEQKADTWATIDFLNDGWCISSAMYALLRVLGNSDENVYRIIYQDELLKHLAERYYA